MGTDFDLDDSAWEDPQDEDETEDEAAASDKLFEDWKASKAGEFAARDAEVAALRTTRTARTELHKLETRVPELEAEIKAGWSAVYAPVSSGAGFNPYAQRKGLTEEQREELEAKEKELQEARWRIERLQVGKDFIGVTDDDLSKQRDDLQLEYETKTHEAGRVDGLARPRFQQRLKDDAFAALERASRIEAELKARTDDVEIGQAKTDMAALAERQKLRVDAAAEGV